MASLEAPLISNRDQADDDDDAPRDDELEPTAVEAREAAPGVFVWLLTLSAGISGLLFGCKGSLGLVIGLQSY